MISGWRMSRWGRELPGSDSQLWRMHKSRLWTLTIIGTGVWVGGGVWLMLKGVFELAVLGIVTAAIGVIWVWILAWLPKAALTSSDLWVMNRLRTYRIDLEEIRGLVERASFVTFILTDGRRIAVSAINGWYAGEKWYPVTARHRERFVRAVLEAKDLKERSHAAGDE